MATANVTSIGANERPRRANPQANGRAKSSPSVDLGSLTDARTFTGFKAYDLISGLHAVCVVLDNAIVDGVEFDSHHNTLAGLAQAAMVLSSILDTEVHS